MLSAPKKKHLQILDTHKEAYGTSAVNVNKVYTEFKVSLGLNGRVAMVLTSVYGSMWFVYFLLFGVVGWMLVQMMLGKQAFDPYPFIFCLFVGNLVQLLGGPIIQVGQNLSSAHSELRAEADYHVNQASFDKLAALEAMQLEILRRLEARGIEKASD